MSKRKPPGFDKFDALMRKLVKVPPSAAIVHWRHANGGNAACGLPNPERFVSNDAMRGVTCLNCLRVFNQKVDTSMLRRKKK